jgi:hypothetical protein
LIISSLLSPFSLLWHFSCNQWICNWSNPYSFYHKKMSEINLFFFSQWIYTYIHKIFISKLARLFHLCLKLSHIIAWWWIICDNINFTFVTAETNTNTKFSRCFPNNLCKMTSFRRKTWISKTIIFYFIIPWLSCCFSWNK